MVYCSFFKHPQQHQNSRLLLIGGLKMEERLLHYLLVWLLCPRGSNHAQCSEFDLMIMYGILQSIPINWPHLIQSIMYKAKRLDSAPLPYPLLVSCICKYKGVDVFNERAERVPPSQKIGDSSLRQMGFKSKEIYTFMLMMLVLKRMKTKKIFKCLTQLMLQDHLMCRKSLL
ncbi:hypothetical protein LR48_Vigan07g173400 [Vigna angularis]|uniref:Uncharacterized protein n=1 Tax=Phaseolus angularis TaxID=3914 RepID=A0A0L9UYV5_PHAAN|nr:hypothetical protein LR48_Vigan07g173400 [Vigna angularis]